MAHEGSELAQWAAASPVSLPQGQHSTRATIRKSKGQLHVQRVGARSDVPEKCQASIFLMSGPLSIRARRKSKACAWDVLDGLK